MYCIAARLVALRCQRCVLQSNLKILGTRNLVTTVAVRQSKPPANNGHVETSIGNSQFVHQVRDINKSPLPLAEDVKNMNDKQQIQLLQVLKQQVKEQDHVTGLLRVFLTWSHMRIDDAEFLILLESRAALLAPELSTKACIKILHSLAVKKSRNPSLINTLIKQLSEKPASLSVKDFSDLMFSASSLKLNSQQILENIKNVCTPFLMKDLRINYNNTKIVRLITSFGKLRWYEPDILQDLCESLKFQSSATQSNAGASDRLTIRQFTDILMTCSIVGYLPNVLKSHVPNYLQLARSESIQSYLDIVWSLLCLGVKSPNIIKEVLTPQHITELLKSTGHERLYNSIRLCNLATELKLNNIPVPAILYELIKFPEMGSATIQEMEISKSLPELFTTETSSFMRRVFTPSAHKIDFLLLWDTKLKRIVIEPDSYERLEKSTDADVGTPVPAHYKWVALILNQHADKTVRIDKEAPIIGRKQLTINQLQSLGFKLIQIDMSKYSDGPSQKDRMKYLENIIFTSLDLKTVTTPKPRTTVQSPKPARKSGPPKNRSQSNSKSRSPDDEIPEVGDILSKLEF